jgi:hypothetical protein
VNAPAAREAARDILAERRFHGIGVPRPFEGPLDWLGDRLRPVIDWVDSLGTDAPGGPAALWTALAVLVVLASTWVVRRSIRHATATPGGGAQGRTATGESPRALEREADAAERAHEWERAVRLRFRAGLLRLDARSVVAYRPSLTTGEVAAALGSPEFARVGERFDAIVYGGCEATAADAGAVRQAWDAVLA